MPTVDFFTNCWERDYREMLSPGYVPAKVKRFGYQFRKVVVTINNVNDIADAKQQALKAKERGDIDDYVFVTEELSRALKICGLKESALGKVANFLGFLLVVVTCTDSDYVLFLASDCELQQQQDWVTPALEKLASDDHFLIANPCWSFNIEEARHEATRVDGPYYISQGFSDQCFLGKRWLLAQPIYHFKHPDGARYPMSDLGDIFEKRVDAFMRVQGYFRLTDSRIAYDHLGETGASYPVTPFAMRVRNKIRKILMGKR